MSQNEHPVIVDFINYLKTERGLAPLTVESYLRDIKQFQEFLINEYQSSQHLTSFEIIDIQLFLGELSKRNLTASTRQRKLSSLRLFTKFLIHEQLRQDNPLVTIASPKEGDKLPKFLSINEMQRLLEAPKLNTLYGVRDRVMLEVMYATGLRVSELCQLSLDQTQLDFGFIRVIGKGKKERLIPISERLNVFLDQYLNQIRPQLLKDKETNLVFLTQRGSGFTRQGFWKNLKKYLIVAGLSEDISPHTLRHSFASHLLQNGANLRVIQDLLGHENISTTEVYTHLNTSHLRHIYNQSHPRE